MSTPAINASSHEEPVKRNDKPIVNQADLQRFRTNNFDLIRLAAALQVVFLHTSKHLGLIHPESVLSSIIDRFPGVPIFFFVSGFLISRSFETNPGLGDYSRNRAFRIFPALWVCFMLSVLSVWLTGYFSTVDVPIPRFLAWTAAQLSFLQIYNPEFMRGYGTGVLNGSLWTITVELQFYFIIPCLYLLLRRLSRKGFDAVLIPLIVVLAMGHQYFYRWSGIDFSPGATHNLFTRAYGVSFVPWVYMFLIGTWAQRNFEWAIKLVKGRVLLLLVGYACMSFLMVDLLGLSLPGQRMDPLSYLVLAMLTLSVAYSAPTLANRILRRNDISYGVYIYHMPVVNLFIYVGFVGTFGYQILVFLITIVLATLSWLFIERPAMKLKRHALNPLRTSRRKAPG